MTDHEIAAMRAVLATLEQLVISAEIDLETKKDQSYHHIVEIVFDDYGRAESCYNWLNRNLVGAAYGLLSMRTEKKS